MFNDRQRKFLAVMAAIITLLYVAYLIATLLSQK